MLGELTEAVLLHSALLPCCQGAIQRSAYSLSCYWVHTEREKKG